MAKKMRRARRSQPSQSFRPAPSQATPTSEAARPTPGAPPAAGNGKKVDFATEYFYVLHDLRTMGIIAAVMLAMLIVLSFVVH